MTLGTLVEIEIYEESEEIRHLPLLKGTGKYKGPYVFHGFYPAYDGKTMAIVEDCETNCFSFAYIPHLRRWKAERKTEKSL